MENLLHPPSALRASSKKQKKNVVFQKKDLKFWWDIVRHEYFLSFVLNTSQAEGKLYLINKEKYTTT